MQVLKAVAQLELCQRCMFVGQLLAAFNEKIRPGEREDKAKLPLLHSNSYKESVIKGSSTLAMEGDIINDMSPTKLPRASLLLPLLFDTKYKLANLMQVVHTMNH